jgi:hypothetical protein
LTWNAPITWTVGQTVTFSQLNSQIRDNMLETAAAKATTAGSLFAGTGANSLAERIPNQGTTLASDTCTSSTFVDMGGGAGASLTITSGPKALVVHSATMANSTVNAQCLTSLDISGATTSLASDTRALRHISATANASFGGSYLTVYAVTSGSNTFLMKYRVSGGTGTFDDRRVAAVPF